MRQEISQHEGSKYLRKIYPADVRSSDGISIDVYSVIKAFDIKCPAIQHAVKKLLCCGLRGKGDSLADLKGVLAAVNRAIDLEEQRLDIEGKGKDNPTLLPQVQK